MTALDVIKKVGGNRTVQRSLLQLRKHSPTLLTAVGVVGVVTAGVMASRASMDVNELIARHKADIDVIKKTYYGPDESDKKQYNKDLTGVYLDTTKQMVKKYGPAVSLATVSIVAIVTAQGIMRQRNLGLALLVKTAETAFGEYRARVVEELGADKDRDFRFGITEETITDATTGKKTKVAKIGSLQHSEYARFFDEGNINWDRDPGYSILFLKAQQDYANKLLLARGHVTLNDVYDSLGFDRIPAGQLVGWVYKKGAPSEDNWIDFGIYDLDSSQGRKFVNGTEKNILLDFNIQGVIYEMIY